MILITGSKEIKTEIFSGEDIYNLEFSRLHLSNSSYSYDFKLTYGTDLSEFIKQNEIYELSFTIELNKISGTFYSQKEDLLTGACCEIPDNVQLLIDKADFFNFQSQITGRYTHSYKISQYDGTVCFDNTQLLLYNISVSYIADDGNGQRDQLIETSKKIIAYIFNLSDDALKKMQILNKEESFSNGFGRVGYEIRYYYN